MEKNYWEQITSPLAFLTNDEKQFALAKLQTEIKSCQKCESLCTTRTQTVFGVGALQPKICFVGEAPGRDEDLQGFPFVGRAGKLLTLWIQAMGFRREDVYICNILKCRPPDNRRPLPIEVEQCTPYLDKQLKLVAPEIICCLGAVAAQFLLKTETPISQLRGKFFERSQIPVLCTYHPAYILRNPVAIREVLMDLEKIMVRFGKENMLNKTAFQEWLA